MLSPAASWTNAFADGDVPIVFLAEINTGSGNFGDGFKITNRPHDTISRFDAPVAIQTITPLNAKLDIVTRRNEIGSVTVTVDDAWVRPILQQIRLKGKRMIITFGATGVPEGDFLSYFTGLIDGVYPDGIGQTVDLEVMSYMQWLENQKIRGFWINDHPLEAIEDILTNRSSLPASIVNATSFDPSQTEYNEISHFVVSRAGGIDFYRDAAVRDPTPALDLIDELNILLNGMVTNDEDGLFKFVIFDSAAATVADWDAGHILPGSLRQTALNEDLVNVVEFAWRERLDRSFEQLYTQRDETSRGNYAFPDSNDRDAVQRIESQWLDNSAGVLQTSITDVQAVPFDIDIAGTMLHGFAGCRDALPGASQPANAKISATRPLYLRINDEIFRSDTAITFFDGQFMWFQITDPQTGTLTVFNSAEFTSFIRVTIDARAQLGTSAEAHTGGAIGADVVYDYTIPVDVATKKLARQVEGLPIITLETHIDQWAVQIGDLVTVDWAEYLDFGFDGIDNTSKWEVIGKQDNFFAREPSIKWTLAFAGENTGTKTHQATTMSVSDLSAVLPDSIYRGDETMEKHIKTGGIDITPAGGLSGDLEAGEGSNGIGSHKVDAVAANGFTASRDTYVMMDMITGQLALREVPNNDPAPDQTQTEELVAIVVTDGSGITSVDSTQKTTAMDGVAINDETVDTLQVANAAIKIQQMENVHRRGQNLGTNGDFSQASRG